MIAREKALEAIDSAIKDYTGDTGPGRWVAKFWHTGHGAFPALVYEYAVPAGTFQAHVYKHVVPRVGMSQCVLPGPEWRAVSDPWGFWGGNKIVGIIGKKLPDIYAGKYDADFWPLASIYKNALLFFMSENDKMNDALKIIESAIASYYISNGFRGPGWQADAVYFQGELKPALVYVYTIDEDSKAWPKLNIWGKCGGDEIVEEIEKTGKLTLCGREVFLGRQLPYGRIVYEVAIFTTTE